MRRSGILRSGAGGHEPAGPQWRLVAGALALAAAAAPGTAAGWETPVALTGPVPDIAGPFLATGASGALLTWQRYIAPRFDGALPGASQVGVAVRMPGAGAWRTMPRLSAGDELSFAPTPAITRAGVASVRWMTVRRGITDVTWTAAELSPAGWSVTPLDDAARSLDTWRVVGDDGTVADVSSSMFPRREIRARVLVPGGGARESAPITPPDGEIEHVGLTPQGVVLIVTLARAGGDAQVSRIHIRTWDPRTDTWAIEEGPAISGVVQSMSVVTLADGTILGAALVGFGDAASVVVASRPPGGPFGSPQAVTTGPLGSGVRVAAGASGHVVLAGMGRRAPWVAVRASDGTWSGPQTGPSGPCVTTESLASLAVGPSGEALLATTAGFASDRYPGVARAWLRAADGSWTGPAWLSRAFASPPTTGIDGEGRLYAAWSRRGLLNPRVEVTSAVPGDAALDAVPAPLPVLTDVRVRRAGRRALVGITADRAGTVILTVSRAGHPGTVGARRRVRRGRTTIAIRADAATGLAAGRWTVTVRAGGEDLSGCPVTRRVTIPGGAR